MSFTCTLPAGTYFVGDAGHLYHDAVTKPPAMDPSVPQNEELLDWFLNDVASCHHQPKYDAVGMCTGARNEVRLTTTHSQYACRQADYQLPLTEACTVLVPHFTFYVLPISLFPREWLEKQGTPADGEEDDYREFGQLIEFTSPVRVLLSVQDWVHSQGFLTLESTDKVVLMEYGFPHAPIFMPTHDLEWIKPNGEQLYGDISLQDLQTLVVALSAYRYNGGRADSRDFRFLPVLHPRLNKHIEMFDRFEHVHGASKYDNVLHGVLTELSARYIQADVQLRDYAVTLSSKKRRLEIQ